MYRFETVYTKEHIEILTRAQVHAYCWKRLMVTLLLGIFLIGISVTSINNKQLAVISTAAGCWLCISLTYPAQYLTRNIHKKMNDENRKFSYLFDQNAIHIESGSNRNKVSYDQIQKIIETKREFCVFLTGHAGFLLSKIELKDQHAVDTFKEFIKEHTGLMIEKEEALFLRLLKLRLIKSRV